MKRFLIILMALSLLVLAACGQSAPAASPAPEEAEQSAEVIVEEAPAPDAELLLLLDRLRDGVQPGTAGGSLKAAGVAAELLDWAATGPAQESVDASVRDWLALQSAETRELLPVQLESLQGAAELLVTDYEGSAGLLEDAGLAGRGPWDEDAAARVSALLEALNAPQS